MKIIVTNAFAISMLPDDVNDVIFVKKPKAKEWLHACLDEGATIVSAIGHANTAAVISAELQMPLEANRINVTMQTSSVYFDEASGLLVAQYKGPRLPEGATEIPEGATIEYWYVEIPPVEPVG